MLLSHKDFINLDAAGCLHPNHSLGKQTSRTAMLLSHKDFLILDAAGCLHLNHSFGKTNK